MSDIENYIASFKNILSVLEKKPELAQLLKEKNIFDVNLIDKIAKNERLYKRYNNGKFEKYQFLSDALDHYANDKILVYFSDINHYALFENLKQYKDFAQNLADLQDEEDVVFNPFQIVLAGQQQKLVFIFTGIEEKIDTLRQMIKKEFASDITVNNVHHVEITVQDVAAIDHKNSVEIFDKIYNFVYKRDRELAMQLHRVPLQTECCKNYLQFGLHNSVRYMELQELEKILKSILPGSTNTTVNIVMGDNNGQMAHEIKIKNNKYDAAKQWISINPPSKKELTKDYYTRYAATNSNPICCNLFGPLVKELGYRSTRGTNGRYWSK